MSRHATVPDEQVHQRAVAQQVCSLLLGYPDEELLAQLDLIDRAVAGLSPEVREPLRRLLGWLRSSTPTEAGAHYVRIIDQKRSCAPYLTYYAHGDTRRRGMALLRFSQAYSDAGVAPPTRELPDHLGVVLEFAATVDPEVGLMLLQEHRPGLQLLVRSLDRHRSPYADLVRAVLATLPAPTREELEAAARIAAEGPPQELVGISGYDQDPVGGLTTAYPLDPRTAAEVRR